MMSRQKSDVPKRFSQILWWVFLLVGLVVAFFVLRNFTMNFVMFLMYLGLFLGAGATFGHFLGTYIDTHHRTYKGLLKQERRTCGVLLKWLRKIMRRKGKKLQEPIHRKLTECITRLGDLLDSGEADRAALMNERGRAEQFIQDHLVGYKKNPALEYFESIGVAVLIALFLRAFVIEAFQIPSGSMIPTLRVGDHIFVNKLSYGMRIPLLPLKIFGTKIDALSWNWSMPDPGDVIVFITPENETEDYIKRVVAVGGDTVEVKNGLLFINGELRPQSNSREFVYNDLDEEGRFRGRVSTKFIEEDLDGHRHPILRKTCTSRTDCIDFKPLDCDPASDPDCTSDKKDCDWNEGICEQSGFGPYTVPDNHVFVMGDNRDNSRDSRFWFCENEDLDKPGCSVPMKLVKGRAVFIWWSYREEAVRWDRMFTSIL